MLKVTVDRRTWYRGKTEGSALLRPDGQKCCMGFACLAAGLSKIDISDVLTVDTIGRSYECQGAGLDFPTSLQPFLDSSLSTHVYQDNDDDELSDDERESNLTKDGAQLGIAFTFKN